MEGAVKLRCHSGKDEPRSWFLCDVEFVLTGLHNVQYLSLPRYDNYHYITIGPMLGLPWSIERAWPFTDRGRILNFREHTSRCSDSPWYTKLYRSVEVRANSHSDTRRRRTLKERAAKVRSCDAKHKSAIRQLSDPAAISRPYRSGAPTGKSATLKDSCRTFQDGRLWS